MRLRYLPAFFGVAAALTVPTPAGAEMIGPWSLNTTLCGGPPMPSCTGGPWGTVWLSDNGHRVDGTVSVVDPATIRDVWLNFSDSFFDESGDLPFTMLAYIGAGTPFEVKASKDGEKADGYHGYYDLNIPVLGHDPVMTLTFTLCRGTDLQESDLLSCDDSFDLDPDDFNLQDQFTITHVAVFRNGAGGEDPVPNILMDSVMDGVSAPEPGSLVLVGTGLAVVARRFRTGR